MKSHIVAGNILKDSPTKIWKSSLAKKIRQDIKKCPGCLNTWGIEWSLASSVYPFIPFVIKKPSIFFRKK